jgi:hypothetical protein
MPAMIETWKKPPITPLLSARFILAKPGQRHYVTVEKPLVRIIGSRGLPACLPIRRQLAAVS